MNSNLAAVLPGALPVASKVVRLVIGDIESINKACEVIAFVCDNPDVAEVLDASIDRESGT